MDGPSLDAAFCIHCALMVPAKDRQGLGHFVNIPVIKFHKIDEKAKELELE